VRSDWAQARGYHVQRMAARPTSLAKGEPLMVATYAIIVAFLLSGAILTGTANAQPYAYITNHGSDSVSVLDLALETVIATVNVEAAPVGVAVAPNARHVYVANRGSGSLSVIRTAANAVIDTISVGGIPEDVAITPVSRPSGTGTFKNRFTAYVPNSITNVVSVIDAGHQEVVAQVGVGSLPQAAQSTPDGTKVYVANYSAGTVSVIWVSDNAVLTTIQVGNGPIAIAFSPDGATAYVLNVSSTVSVIDTATNTVVPGITPVDTFYAASVPNQTVTGMALSHSGSRLYVLNYVGNLRHGFLIERDATTYLEIRVADLGPLTQPPQRIAANADGTRLFITTSTGSFTPGAVLVIDTETLTVLNSVEVGAEPIGIAISE
jgi:YVTN family beta-propeller protein